MENYYFTFGNMHPYHDYCQQIVATNKANAKTQMYFVFGENWADCFEQEEFEFLVKNGQYINKAPLPPIYKRYSMV